jgi:hypothetical protein
MGMRRLEEFSSSMYLSDEALYRAKFEIEVLKQRDDLTPQMHIEIEFLEIQIDIWIYTDPDKTYIST